MYNYSNEKHKIFTEDGQVLFLKIRDKINFLLKKAGAINMSSAISGNTGNSWEMMACVDRLVELEEIREITESDVAGQNRIFVRN